MIKILPIISITDSSIKPRLSVKFLLMAVLFILTVFQGQSQSISGQWIGKFNSEQDLNGNGTDYVLEIESNGNQLSGFSYTYFSIAGKRYYVICKLKGNYDKSSKSMVISEIETIKTNTPPDFENCHQSHQLTYLKQSDKEVLVGKWKPTEKGSTCGRGTTELERKALVKINNKKTEEGNSTAVAKKSNTATKQPTTKPQANKTSPAPNQKQQTNTASKPPVKNEGKPIAKSTPQKTTSPEPSVAKPQEKNEKQPVAKESIAEKKPTEKTQTNSDPNKTKSTPHISKEKLAKRSNQVIKIIEVSDPKIKIDIYDNGQIDGDVVSIFLNDRQLVSSKMLTAQPITLQISIDDDEETYDLIMFAESLGSIPPNTALMIITTATERHEINISSNEQTSGAVRFRLKK